MAAANNLPEDEKRHDYNNERTLWDERQTYFMIDHHLLPPRANVTCSHTNIKGKDYGCVKARIVPCRYGDLAKQELRPDSPCKILEIFRLNLSIAVERKWNIRQMDTTAALLQARSFIKKKSS